MKLQDQLLSNIPAMLFPKYPTVMIHKYLDTRMTRLRENIATSHQWAEGGQEDDRQVVGKWRTARSRMHHPAVVVWQPHSESSGTQQHTKRRLENAKRLVIPFIVATKHRATVVLREEKQEERNLKREGDRQTERESAREGPKRPVISISSVVAKRHARVVICRPR